MNGPLKAFESLDPSHTVCLLQLERELQLTPEIRSRILH